VTQFGFLIEIVFPNTHSQETYKFMHIFKSKIEPQNVTFYLFPLIGPHKWKIHTFAVSLKNVFNDY